MDVLRNIAESLATRSGLIGGLAVRVIGESDRLMLEWMVSLLDIKQGDTLLDLCCGYGGAIRLITRRYLDTFVVGADSSRTALDHSWRTNKTAIRERRAMLLLTDFKTELPIFTSSFNKIYAVNPLTRLEDPAAAIAMARKKLIPGGKIVLSAQPREKGATDAEAVRLGKAMRQYLNEAGFKALSMQEKELTPVAAVCATGINP